MMRAAARGVQGHGGNAAERPAALRNIAASRVSNPCIHARGAPGRVNGGFTPSLPPPRILDRFASTGFPLRPAVLTLALVLALGAATGRSQELPDIGSSAGELITPAQQAEYGAMLLAQLRHHDYLLEDPLLDSWLDTLGTRLAANSDQPRQPFTFFLMRQREVNAFATLGGYIGLNAGLVLAAEREDEVAAVLAHEIAHVTQAHVLRGVERAQRDQLPILLAMLGAIVAAQAAGGNSSDDAAQAAIVSAMGLMQQRQIDYTRSNEHEADRIGIQTLARSGFDPMAMADFFGTMERRSRVNQAGIFDTPDYLRTHPVNTTRISEAKERAGQLARAPQAFDAGMRSDNPLLPSGVDLSATARAAAGASGRFDFARERMRVFSAETPRAAIRDYERAATRRPLGAAQRYGLAVARLRAGEASAAAGEFDALLAKAPNDAWLSLGLAEAHARAGRHAQADALFDALLRATPDNRAVVLTYAAALAERGSPEAGRRAQAVLRPLAARAGDDAVFQRTMGRAHEVAGDAVRAGEAFAEAAYLGGRAEQALVQLNRLKARGDLDYYARARIDARIAQITPTVLELKRQGVRDPDLKRR